MKKTAIIGLSGGVDSSVAAALLIKSGFNVIGLFMHNWEEEDEFGECRAAEDANDARVVAEKLKIPFYSVNFAKQYMENVFEYFLSEYKAGRTPNPDVLCNREIKFGCFKDYAMKMGADVVATGHYADLRINKNDIHLMKSLDQNKDQTYFLNQVKTRQFENVLFPLGGIENKSDVRKMAEELNLITANKKDSTGICFIGERKFREFLSGYLPAQGGEIRDTSGKFLGRHHGLMYYTLGQRKGLGIGGIKGEEGNRWFVVEKNLKENVLVLSCGEGQELLSESCSLEGFNWIGQEIEQDIFECDARFRHRQELQKIKVIKTKNDIKIEFDTKQRAVTPGQYAVLYLGDRCLGGGKIK
ncbi:MAG: tRNA 2-thiouridine(34) synthase MnmA [Firmicutes bacterium]|nr:tRNA 2-thiouridine(34) synthase MnmA [Bacillota bacterium]